MSKMINTTELQAKDILDDNCSDRIKPALLRDVKCEALLVFSRTALERFFAKLHSKADPFEHMSSEYKEHIYTPLLTLLDSLQKHVVNADYLIDLMRLSKKYPQLQPLVQFESPLMYYYDAMAQRVAQEYKDQEMVLPEFLVICILSHWIIEEQKSTSLFPFLDTIDYTSLIEKFESNRDSLHVEDRDMVYEIQNVAVKVVERLKGCKYKFNKRRRSKKRRH